jgi:hypothetical protein
MGINTVNNTMHALLIQHELHTNLFHNVIDGITESDASRRLNEANHISWLTGNLVSLRYKVLNALGIHAEQKFPSLFKDNKGIQQDVIYPSLVELKEDWDIVSPVLQQKLSGLTSQELSHLQPFPIPTVTDKTFLASLTFLSHREAYGIGQIGLLRRILGYEAMSYKIKRGDQVSTIKEQ